MKKQKQKPDSKGLLICIDPGHGGKDPGAVYGGVKEKDINLDAALQLEKLLNENGIETIMTRIDDADTPLGVRVGRANARYCQLFISLHCNAAVNHGPYGMQVYVHSQERDKSLGKALFEALDKAYGEVSKWSGSIVHPGYYILANTNMPAVIIEMGYLSNDNDRKKLAGKEYIPALMQALTDFVLESQSKKDI